MLSPVRPTTDGVVTIRQGEPGDVPALVAGRDSEFHRWLGPGSAQPQPSACVLVGDDIAGWVDYDVDREWLQAGEVNIGYNVFAPYRGNGYATRSLQLLMHHLASSTAFETATLLVDPRNGASVGVGGRARFEEAGSIGDQLYFKRDVPPLSYSDGVVTIRRQRATDLGMHLDAIDTEQMDRLRNPGDRELWEAMSPDEQQRHQLRHLQASHGSFGSGPKWSFSVDALEADYVAYVDCDLANRYGLPGEANISYCSHPSFRGKGYVSRAVRLLQQFLREHTATRTAVIVVEPGNLASLRVAGAVGAVEVGRLVDGYGRTMIRHVLTL